MLLKSLGQPPHDDYGNYDALHGRRIFSDRTHADLVEFNGLRNALVHEYDGRSDDRALDAAQRLLPGIHEAIQEVRTWLTHNV